MEMEGDRTPRMNKSVWHDVGEVCTKDKLYMVDDTMAIWRRPYNRKRGSYGKPS